MLLMCRYITSGGEGGEQMLPSKGSSGLCRSIILFSATLFWSLLHLADIFFLLSEFFVQIHFSTSVPVR